MIRATLIDFLVIPLGMSTVAVWLELWAGNSMDASSILRLANSDEFCKAYGYYDNDIVCIRFSSYF